MSASNVNCIPSAVFAIVAKHVFSRSSGIFTFNLIIYCPSIEIFDDILTGIPKDTEICVAADRSNAINQAIAHASFGDVILVAGKGHEDYQILGEETIKYDDREIARKALLLKLNS